MSQHNLETRLHYLESCEAIRSLVGRYATAAPAQQPNHYAASVS